MSFKNPKEIPNCNIPNTEMVGDARNGPDGDVSPLPHWPWEATYGPARLASYDGPQIDLEEPSTLYLTRLAEMRSDMAAARNEGPQGWLYSWLLGFS